MMHQVRCRGCERGDQGRSTVRLTHNQGSRTHTPAHARRHKQAHPFTHAHGRRDEQARACRHSRGGRGRVGTGGKGRGFRGGKRGKVLRLTRRGLERRRLSYEAAFSPQKPQVCGQDGNLAPRWLHGSQASLRTSSCHVSSHLIGPWGWTNVILSLAWCKKYFLAEPYIFC